MFCWTGQAQWSLIFLMAISYLSDKTFYLITGFSGAFPGFWGFTTDFIYQLLIFLISPIIFLLNNNVSSTILWLLKLTGNQCTQAELIRIFHIRMTNEQISIYEKLNFAGIFMNISSFKKNFFTQAKSTPL